MKRLALILIVGGILIGPLLTTRAMVASFNAVSSGQDEAVVQSAMSQSVRGAMTGTMAGLAVVACGCVLLLLSWYQGRHRKMARLSPE